MAGQTSARKQLPQNRATRKHRQRDTLSAGGRPCDSAKQLLAAFSLVAPGKFLVRIRTFAIADCPPSLHHLLPRTTGIGCKEVSRELIILKLFANLLFAFASLLLCFLPTFNQIAIGDFLARDSLGKATEVLIETEAIEVFFKETACGSIIVVILHRRTQLQSTWNRTVARSFARRSSSLCHISGTKEFTDPFCEVSFQPGA
mmetsp:Transcript_8560/g.19161  ORF Transcript_8560/g.19161 Transcript_8560/m.19161 type:complete len:202 (+) Transcript_8560:234-839(+)